MAKVSFLYRSLSFLFFLLPISATLQAKTIYVSRNAVGANNGTSWANAFTRLQTALEAAQSDDEVWVAKGRYASAYLPAYPYICLKSGVKVYGGFIGTETTLEARNWQANETVIYGNNRNVLYCEATAPGTLLDGFTIQDGRAAVLDQKTQGCNWLQEQSLDCVGGGIFVYNADETRPTFLAVSNCRFKNNWANYGAGLGLNFGHGSGGLTLYNCLFENNATNTAVGGGGALAILCGPDTQAHIEVEGCVFRNNESGLAASALQFLNYSPMLTMRVTRCLFENNKAFGGAMYGGHFVDTPHNVTMENCVFEQNQAGRYPFERGSGGALTGFWPYAKNCHFIGNRAYYGGAIACNDITLENCLFADNSALGEGGVFRGGATKLFNCTFVNNKAGEVGAIKNVLVKCQDTILNCVFWNNTERGERGTYYASGGLNAYFAHCAFDLDSCEALFQGVDPINNSITCGPGMLWGAVPALRDTTNGDYRLSVCSPLIDKGDAFWAERQGIDVDLGGNPRIIGASIDIGAYETRESSLTVEADIRHASGPSTADGGIYLTSPLGGVPPYTFHWSNAFTTNTLENLASGVYSVTVADATGCSAVLEYSVSFSNRTGEPIPPLSAHIWAAPNFGQVPLLVLASDPPQSTFVSIVDIQGRTITTFQTLAHLSLEYIPLEALAFKTGLFFVRLRTLQGENVVLKVVK